MVVVGCVGAAASITSGLIGMGSARRAARAAARAARARAKELDRLEKSRQAIINPYEGVKDVSSLASDLSGMISNPYASLGVAVKAAEFQAEQADMSLANTLDTLQQTGASAGGATALAQAALQSKKGISASIEMQEAENNRLRAQGEQQMQQIKMSEAQRLQGIQLSEAQRLQQAEVAGKEFMFNTREDREVARMNRVAGQQQQAEARQMQAQSDYTGALTGMISSLGQIGMSMGKAGAFKGGTGTADSVAGAADKVSTISTATGPAIYPQAEGEVSTWGVVSPIISG